MCSSTAPWVIHMGVASWMMALMGIEHDCSNNGYLKYLDGKLKRTDDLDMSDPAAALNTLLHVEYCSSFGTVRLYIHLTGCCNDCSYRNMCNCT